MKDPRIENVSFSDLYAIHQYVKAKIDSIIEDHEPDPNAPTVIFGEETEESIELTLVPETSAWCDVLSKVEDEIEARIGEIFDL